MAVVPVAGQRRPPGSCAPTTFVEETGAACLQVVQIVRFVMTSWSVKGPVPLNNQNTNCRTCIRFTRGACRTHVRSSNP